MLAGDKPFTGASLPSLTCQSLHVDPVPPSRIRPNAPKASDGIGALLLQHDHSERYQTGRGLVEALHVAGASSVKSVGSGSFGGTIGATEPLVTSPIPGGFPDPASAETPCRGRHM